MVLGASPWWNSQTKDVWHSYFLFELQILMSLFQVRSISKIVRGVIQVVGHANTPRLPKKEELRTWYLSVCFIFYCMNSANLYLQSSYVVVPADHEVLAMNPRKAAMSHGKIIPIGKSVLVPFCLHRNLLWYRGKRTASAAHWGCSSWNQAMGKGTNGCDPPVRLRDLSRLLFDLANWTLLLSYHIFLGAGYSVKWAFLFSQRPW
jgi:hypothetical protein